MYSINQQYFKESIIYNSYQFLALNSSYYHTQLMKYRFIYSKNQPPAKFIKNKYTFLTQGSQPE